MESCRVSSTSDTGLVRDDVTTARRDHHRSGFTHAEGRNRRVSLTNNGNDRTNSAGVRGQASTTIVQISWQKYPGTANSSYSSPREGTGSVLHDSSSEGWDGSQNPAYGRKKVALSPSSPIRRDSPSGGPLTALMSRTDSGSPGPMSWSRTHETSVGQIEREPDGDEEVVWAHGRLLDYRIVDDKPFVLVPWHATWEPPGEYPEAEVDRVRRQYLAQIRGKRRGRPQSMQWI